MKTMVILFLFLLISTASAEPALLGEWEGYWDGREDMKVSLVILKITTELIDPEPPLPTSDYDPRPQGEVDNRPRITETARIHYTYRYGQFEKDVRLIRNGTTKFSWSGRISIFIQSLNRNEFVPFMLTFELGNDGKLMGTLESMGVANRFTRKAEMKKIREGGSP